MNGRDWDAICHILSGAYKGDFTESKANIYRQFLIKYDRAEMEAAMLILSERGQVFLPTPGELIAAIGLVSRVEAPDFTTAMRFIRRIGKYPDDTKFVRWLEEACHPIVAAWVSDFGVRNIRYEEVDDPDYGGLILRRWRHSYDQYVAHGKTNEQIQRALNGHAHPGVKRLSTASALELIPTKTGERRPSAPRQLPAPNPSLDF